MALPEFMQIEAPPFAPRRTLSLLETEQFLLLATYHLWRDDVWPIDGEALDKLRGAFSPHPVRDQNKQFGMNVLEMALERMSTGGLIEIRKRGIVPTTRAIEELERAIAETRKSAEDMLRKILED
ncbi:hypothetical protein KTR66_11700 [Roseococcus sp. SDR]|uniref:hypothetical protein n=1 Tax=Roseococcus sp. SDR TaxID=2835532 RepID=UPI001BCD4838|nr:hypothetical protein [Roseococcus sp. SDR]MBS7790664.1 hypothetical protein [Roseococcus sp. SDR]MBV1845978.1 hypothetical protein [Roseococcus sp. SDR]